MNGGITAECSDIANAERIVAWHGADLRHCHAWGKWLAWDGRRWLVDDTGGATRRAVETTRRLLAEALEEHDRAARALAADPEDERAKAKLSAAKKRVAWAISSQNARRLSSMLSVASSSEEVVIQHDRLDADPWLLNVANGTIDLRLGELRPHAREDLITKIAPVAFEPGASCPTWEAFIRTAMGDREELISFLARVVGYALTGSTREHVLGFFFGGGRNGKSTFLGTLHHLLGDYATPASRGLLFRSNHQRHPTELAALCGARFVTCSEIEQGRAFDEALLKDLTGGDPITARHMQEDFWKFTPTHKLFLAGNHKPTVRGDDEGIWRRMRLVPFTVTIPPEQVDRTLPERLREELPGILAWAVRGCLEWQAKGLGEPKEVLEATAEYREESDPIGEFLSLRCILDPIAKAPRAAIRAAYDDYAKENGVRSPLAAKAFGDALRKRGVTDGGSMRIATKISPVDAWKGIRLRTAEDADDRRVDPPCRAHEGSIPGWSGISVSPGGIKPENVNTSHYDLQEDPTPFASWVQEVLA